MSFAGLGRRESIHAAPQTAQAAGNGRVTQRDETASYGVAGGHLYPVPGPHYAARNQEGVFRATAIQNGRLQVRDRHVALDTGTSRKGDEESNSGIPNPLHDGLPRPALRAINRQETWQIGTDHTTNEDNPGPFATTIVRDGIMADGRTKQGGPTAYPLGSQGDPWSTKLGGTPGLYRPYGVRGVTIGPPIGSSLDGPQKLQGGPPHGRHSPCIPDHQLARIKYYSGAPQQRSARANHPNNSKIAGQSWSQMVVHEDGTTPNPVPRANNPTRTPGMTGRWNRT